MYHRKYGGAGLVIGKDTPDVLEASIMPWLTEDLEAISRKRIMLDTNKDGSVACAFVEKDEDWDVIGVVYLLFLAQEAVVGHRLQEGGTKNDREDPNFCK